ncbi:MAG: TrkH family potassium uptake protein [Pseudomonadota bacterium]
MIDVRPILLVIGVLLTALGLFMAAPMAADLATGSEDWRGFALSAAVTLFVGGGLAASNWGRGGALTVQQGFLLTVSSWVALVAFAALPFTLGSIKLSYTDAFFEAMSGLTTTGSTVITALDDAPKGVLLWRALLQWIGGVGVIIMAIAVFPMLQIGGMQLFRLESSDTSEKILPRANQIAGSIISLYLILSVFCFSAYWALGMTSFDAAAHAMTTIATGGFSTKNASFGHYLEDLAGPADMVAVFFMIVGSLPFGLYLLALRGKTKPLMQDAQVRFFLILVALFTLAMTALVIETEGRSLAMALRLAFFNVVSIMTGTGYATADYGLWGPFAVAFFFCVMFVGGCAGSTSCGLKIFRLQVAIAGMRLHARRLAHPNGVFTERYNGRPLTEDVYTSVLSFFFVYFACFATLAALLSAAGLDTLTALSAAGTSIANVGPGLGEIIGPAGTFAPLSAPVKWLLSFGMLLGRLELFTVLVLFAPHFWRN